MDYSASDENILKEDSNTKVNRDELFRMLDRGIDDMEAGRELPLNEAFEMITKLKTARRSEKV